MSPSCALGVKVPPHARVPESRRGIDRAWWTEVLHESVDAELDWLRATIYRTAGVLHIPQRRITAYDRWRADPSDVAAPPPMTSTTPVAA